MLDIRKDKKRNVGLWPQPLYFVAILGYFPLVKLLVERGCDVHARERYFGSAFAAAAFHGHVRVDHQFLEIGTDPNLQGLRFGSVL